MKRFSRAAVLGATALAAGLVGTAAQAQVEIITVTAQKREQTLLEAPVAVTAVTGETIAEAQIRDAADLQTLVPSLSVGEFAASTNQTFNIRSLGSSSFNPGVEPSVGVFIDGVYVPRQGASINDFLSLERVEVIRGPQSTLFGRNTPAGVVSFHTRQPEFEFGAEGEVTVGNYNARVAAATITGPIVADQLAFRIDGNINQRDGFITNHDGREFNNRDRWSARGQLLWDSGGATTARFIASVGNIDENCCAAPFSNVAPSELFAFNQLGVVLPSGDPFDGTTAIDGPLRTQVDTWGISAEFNHDFGAFTLTSITAYQSYEEDQVIDADFTTLDAAGARQQFQDYNAFTQEFRIASNAGERFDWMAGLFYYNNELTFQNETPYGTELAAFANFASSLDPSVEALATGLGLGAGSGIPAIMNTIVGLNNMLGTPGVPLVPAGGYLGQGQGLVQERYNYDTEAWSAFGQVDWRVTDRFTITAGLRYSRETKDYTPNVIINDPFSELDAVALGQNLQLPGGLFFVPAILFGGGGAFNPFVPLTQTQAENPAINFLLPLIEGSGLQFNRVNAPFAPGSRTDENLSGSIIFGFDWSDTLNTYLSIGTGYKPGGFSLNSNSAATGLFQFEEETTLNIEIGVKGTAFDNRMVYAIALFDQTNKDFQTEVFVGGGFYLDNAGEISVRGLEVETTIAPTQNLVFGAGFTWLFQNRYESYEFGPCPRNSLFLIPQYAADPLFADCLTTRVNQNGFTGRFNDLSGVDRGSPEFSGFLTAMYTQPLGNGLEVRLRGETSYVSSQNLNGALAPLPSFQQDAITLVNGSIAVGAEDGAWSLQLWGRNLTDETYYRGTFFSVGTIGPSTNSYPSNPRTYGLTLRARF
ncbi:TonB-dependent receptor [Glycocaulis sp.]|uniref:TonB-dependent receptor n=1 Tax=Glycocaulis sp. TaxID=1969725 RepID=UPI003D24E5F4